MAEAIEYLCEEGENTMYRVPTLPLAIDVETKPVLRLAARAHQAVGEVNGIAERIPKEAILINTLVLQEAKDSSAIENIVTTHDELYIAELDLANATLTAETKEVMRYAEALKYGFEQVRNRGVLNNGLIKEIQQRLIGNSAGFRAVPGTALKNQFGDVVYTPPQTRGDVESLMTNLEKYIHEDDGIDGFIKLAVVHHQFESIHPFYDENGRTGRILNVLLLVLYKDLNLPILYLSRYITRHKEEYYHLLQGVRDRGEWEAWILFMLRCIESTALETEEQIRKIIDLMQKYKEQMREILRRGYSHELLNNLFSYPYTKIEYVMAATNTSRPTAGGYLNTLAEAQLLQKVRKGRSNYYLNVPLIQLLAHSHEPLDDKEEIEHVVTVLEKHEHDM